MKRLLVILLAALTLIAAACGDDKADEPSAADTGEATTEATADDHHRGDDGRLQDRGGARGQGGRRPEEATREARRLEDLHGHVKTNCGSFSWDLDTEASPKTSASIVALAESGFYDDTVFHRIVPGFVIQGGDPTGTGSGGPGYKTRDIPDTDTIYSKGTVAMAKAGTEPSGTSGSQFFVVTDNAGGAQLTPDYAVVGRVSKGEDVVDRIGQLGNAQQQPTQVVLIEKMSREGEVAGRRPILDGVIYDVSQANFEQRVVERSAEVPVVVDFWAEWCGPCRALTPALEKAAQARDGRVDLAKLDTDANQAIAQAFQVQSIPAVKAFKDRRVVSEFVGAVPPAQVERFFDALVPSEEELRTDAAVSSGDEQELRQILSGDAGNARAANVLSRMLLARGDAGRRCACSSPLRATSSRTGSRPVRASPSTEWGRRPGGRGTGDLREPSRAFSGNWRTPTRTART